VLDPVLRQRHVSSRENGQAGLFVALGIVFAGRLGELKLRQGEARCGAIVPSSASCCGMRTPQ
jgi:hypothetical protein